MKTIIVSDESELLEIFSKYFGNIVENLGIDGLTNISSYNDIVTIRKTIEKCQNHPSIKVIRENIDSTNNFSFYLINPECMSKIINNLDTSKDISSSFNSAANKGVFPDKLKYADVKPIYKKESRNEKENYRPVSILPSLQKIFERCMHYQLKYYFDKMLSKYQCGFRKGFSIQHCLPAMKEKLRKSFDSGGASAALLTGISKAFDCLPHDLLIAKLHAYSIKEGSFNLLFSYLKNKKQSVCLNSTYSEWIDIVFGVPQGYMLGLLLFKVACVVNIKLFLYGLILL